MADVKISALGSLTGVASTDVLPIVDVSDTTQAASGSTKKVTADELALRISAAPVTVNAQTGTTYTVLASDAGKLVTLSNASPVTATLTNTIGLSAGQRIDFLALGSGQVTVAAGSGNTLNGTPGLKLRAQYSAASLVCVSANTYVLVGDLTA